MITHGLVQTVNSSQSEAKKEKAADKVAKKTKAKAKAKAKAKVMAKAKAKGKAKVSKQSPRDHEVCSGEKNHLQKGNLVMQLNPKKRRKNQRLQFPHIPPLWKKVGGNGNLPPWHWKGRKVGGKRIHVFKKALDALGELMDAMGAYKGKGDFHGPGPNFKKKFLALINPLNYCETCTTRSDWWLPKYSNIYIYI